MQASTDTSAQLQKQAQARNINFRKKNRIKETLKLKQTAHQLGSTSPNSNNKHDTGN